MSSSPHPVAEHDRIARAMRHYIEGAALGSSQEMTPAFHPDATLHGYFGTDLVRGPIRVFFDWVDRHGPARGLQSRIASVDITGPAATVRLESEGWHGHRVTDYFSLVKAESRWLIVSKVFFMQQETADPIAE